MASSLPFEADAHAALVAGTWTLVVALLVWLEILRLRRRQVREDSIAAQVSAEWHPLLAQASFGMPTGPLRPLRKEEQIHFLKLWLHLQTSLRGDAGSALAALARELHCDELALRMLARGNRGERLLAIVVAGHLGLEPALQPLLAHVASRDSVLSLQALHSALRISPERAASLVPQCVQRDDWPVPQLLTILRPCAAGVAAPLLAALDGPDERATTRAIRLLAGLRIAPDLTTQHKLVSLASPPLLSEALALVDQPALLTPLRDCLRHADQRVRVAAINALARIGDASDLDAMAAMLGDRNWNVRNSAARAIVALPGGGIDGLRRLADACEDRYGRNMAEHVLADFRFAA